MLHLITPENRHKHTDLINQMFRVRHDVFVKKMGWDLDTDGVHEIDQYDTDDCHYLVAVNEEGVIKGAKRFCQTSKPHMLAEVFPHMCEKSLPIGEDIWEVSRFFVTTGLDRRVDRKGSVAGYLMAGMFEWALIHGVRKITCLTNINVFPGMLQAGYDVEPLGLPQIVDRECLIAYAINVHEETWRHLLDLKGLKPGLVPAGSRFPFKGAA